jgi:hypothetical protein
MSDTPETNSIIRNAQAADHPPTRLAATLTVKCGKLERERDEARENLDEEMKFHHQTHRELVETQCKLLDIDLKREEALDEIKRLKVILDLIKKDVS